MTFFDKPFFKSKNTKTESDYESGVKSLAAGDYVKANEFLREAAGAGHVSAFYNLAILNGAGVLSPYDIDFAAECFYNAAYGGHPKAQNDLFMLEAADRGGMGTTHLAALARRSPPVAKMLPYLTMITGCRFYAAICKATGSTQQVIDYELEAANMSDHMYIKRFVRCSGVASRVYKGGMERVKTGSAADQITDGLNQLFMNMRQAGYSDEMCLTARCTIVAYIINQTPYATPNRCLPSVEDFLKLSPKFLTEPMINRRY